MGLLDTAVAPTIDTYEQTPVQSTSVGYDAAQLDQPATTTANTYDAAQASAATYDPAMVEDNLAGLLDRDSDYMKVNTTKALQASNNRGLSNSSMAVGAGQLAAIESALPIATQDAAATNQAGQWNSNALNQVELANQAADNRASLDNATFLNTSDQFNATAQNQADQLNQQATNQANQYNATVENEFALNNMDALNQAARDFTSANNEASLQNAENNMRILLANAQDSLSTYSTDIQRKTALDQIASTLVQSGVSNGIFATSDGAANWLSMIGDLYPDMGLSVTSQLSSQAADSVV
jgi:hypothetical protein